MKELLLYRHAKAEDDHPRGDYARALTTRGQRDAERMAHQLRGMGQVAERVLCSTALRARQTLVPLLEAWDFAGIVDYRRELYLAPPQAIVSLLAQLPESVERVVVVGHNPGFELVVAQFTGTQQPFPKGSVAQLELELRHWADLKLINEPRGRLVGFRHLRDLPE